jgi:hypothetical protein
MPMTASIQLSPDPWYNACMILVYLIVALALLALAGFRPSFCTA